VTNCAHAVEVPPSLGAVAGGAVARSFGDGGVCGGDGLGVGAGPDGDGDVGCVLAGGDAGGLDGGLYWPRQPAVIRTVSRSARMRAP
jgi:hypothetical protein